MIDVDMMTIIDDWPYKCVSVKGGVATLEKVGKKQLLTVDRHTCPYIDSVSKTMITPKNSLRVIPNIKRPKKYKAKTIDIMKIIKAEVDISISRDLVYFVRDHIETIIGNLALEAEKNAIANGDKRMTSRHWYWLEVPIHGTQNIVREHDEMASHIKLNDWE